MRKFATLIQYHCNCFTTNRVPYGKILHGKDNAETTAQRGSL